MYVRIVYHTSLNLCRLPIRKNLAALHSVSA